MVDSDVVRRRHGEGFILGVDGLVHIGWARRSMSVGWLMTTNCGVRGMRGLSDGETWWHGDNARLCRSCNDDWTTLS